MKRSKSERLKRKTEKLIFAIGITSVIFVVATYAWFIGTTQATVNPFEIGVKASDGLTLSLDGDNYSTTIAVSETAIKQSINEELVNTYHADGEAYENNTNHWVGPGLMPLSSIGKYDTTASVLELYSKTSITSLTGGYKLRADKILNGEGGTPTEQDGYVVFDMFVKNLSGDGYNPTFDADDDEGVYLSTDSIVKLQSEGSGGDGIENSIRIAFLQIGRVEASNPAEVATAITCTSDSTVTSLCDKDRGITWNIWEPNDKSHTPASITHFGKICQKRTSATEYSGTCEPIVDGTAVTTYAVNTDITAENNVNIYDGLNDYTESSQLTGMTYFTDTMKNTGAGEGEDREEFFFLAPNSITKIRVYIYLEGQDVDNYDLGTIGKKIEVTFGFTKDKFDMGAVTTTTTTTSAAAGE